MMEIEYMWMRFKCLVLGHYWWHNVKGDEKKEEDGRVCGRCGKVEGI